MVHPSHRSLLTLSPGETGTITAVECAYPPLANRLRSLGFLPGAAITYVQRAPLLGPAIFSLSGCVIALRRTEASTVKIL